MLEDNCNFCVSFRCQLTFINQEAVSKLRKNVSGSISENREIDSLASDCQFCLDFSKVHQGIWNFKFVHR